MEKEKNTGYDISSGYVYRGVQGAVTYLYGGERLRGLRDLLLLVLLSRERARSLSPGLPLSLSLSRSRRGGGVALLPPRFGLGERGASARRRPGDRDGDRDGDGPRLFRLSSSRALGGDARFLSLVLFFSRFSRSEGVSLTRSLGFSGTLPWVLVFSSGLHLLRAGGDGGGLEVSVGVYRSFPRSLSFCRSF